MRGAAPGARRALPGLREGREGGGGERQSDLPACGAGSGRERHRSTVAFCNYWQTVTELLFRSVSELLYLAKY